MIAPLVKGDDLRQQLADDPEALLENCREEYGEVFTLDLETPVTYLLDSVYFKQVLTSLSVDFAPVSRQSKVRFGLEHLVASDAQVRGLSQVFARALRGSKVRSVMNDFKNTLEEKTKDWLDKSGQNETVSLVKLVDCTLVPASAEALFGRNIFYPNLSNDISIYSQAVSSRLIGDRGDLGASGQAAEAQLLAHLAGCLDAKHRTSFVDSLFRNGLLAA